MIELDRLAQLDATASAAPWHVRYLDDDRCMGAVGISTEPDTGKQEDLPSFDYPEPNLLALCLLQWPPHVIPRDRKWDENADLIVAMRNALPELIRLAHIGAAMEGPS
jgi:hypothetical protein